jgi:pSer/pThr/pTyr-binding forkhead associated (FHA) protein
VKKRTLVGSLTPDHAPDNVFPLLDAEQTIGRAPTNQISIADGSVSSVHARILRTAEGFVLEDLQSRNGTFVNGEKVDGKRPLADGDLIRLGKIIMTFNVAREGKAGDTTQPEVRVV